MMRAREFLPPGANTGSVNTLKSQGSSNADRERKPRLAQQATGPRGQGSIPPKVRQIDA
jgi:hypothetical protein